MPHPPFRTTERFSAFLARPDMARAWLTSLGVRDPERGWRDLRELGERGIPAGLMTRLVGRLDAVLPRCPDPGMALTNLERFVAASSDPTAALTGLVADDRAVEIAVQLFSTSQFFSEVMIRDPSLLDWLRAGPERRDPSQLLDDLWREVAQAPTDDARRLALRRFRLREVLRIGYNDIVRNLPLEQTTLDLSHLADACVAAAVRSARLGLETRHGSPRRSDGHAARFVVLALGKLGGAELNYSSDIDLIFVYDADGTTSGSKVIGNAQFFAKVGAEVVRTLADHTSLGMAYRVDMRLRPEGDQGPLARSLAATLNYYQTSGRTWERQALIKARAVAGDLDLGADFLAAITPFVYRRHLAGAEIGEIKAMKRRIEQRTMAAGTASVEVKTGHGGIRDVEFVVQFLQLLHGGEYPEVRQANTLAALGALEAVGCLTPEERGTMDNTYRFLRRVEHRLQTMFDRQTHEMPRDLEEQRTLAIRLGYPPTGAWEDRTGPAERFRADYRSKTEKNRSILNHLLHDAFRSGDGPPDGPVEPVVDLVLDPDPQPRADPDLIDRALSPYPFRDRAAAYANLMALARESEYLSAARCRHFLAGIAPRLLDAVARAPDPDLTLANLEKVSASLGAKGMLWELFHLNSPTLRLYVEVCATSQLVSETLISNPGMIDDLMDSLVVDRPQTAHAIHRELAELCHRAEDLGPILLGFRNKEWIRIGTRAILRRDPVRDMTRELSDVAEAIVIQAARDQWRGRVRRFGLPRRQSDGRACPWAIIALGKLGGRELHYHGDLDLIFVYEEEGTTRGRVAAPPIGNGQFYGEVARRTLRTLAEASGWGTIYPVDARLRPFGASGPIVLPLAGFAAYYRDEARDWERLALTRARVLGGPGRFGTRVAATIQGLLAEPSGVADLAGSVRAIRRRLEASRGPADLKRGAGGLLDVEFLAQFLTLRHASAGASISANTWDALDAHHAAGRIAATAYRDLRDAYTFIRSVDGLLRLQRNRSVPDWPTRPDEVGRLVAALRSDPADDSARREDPAGSVAAWAQTMAQTRQTIRHWFDQLVVD